MENKEAKTTVKAKKSSFSQKFSAFYKKNILPELEPVEKERKKYLYICISIFLIATMAGIFICILNSSINITIIVLAEIIAFSAVKVIQKIFKEKAKAAILPKILSFLGTFEINKDNEFLNTYVDDLHLFNPYSKYIYDDRLKGKYKGLDIVIEEICLEAIDRNNDKHSREHTVRRNRKNQEGSVIMPAKWKFITDLIDNIINIISNQSIKIEIGQKVFSGIFIRVPSMKKYTGRTIVKAEKTYHNIKEEKKVILEDIEFEKLYDTFSTDQIEARYLLTTAFMDRMVMLSKKGIGKRILVSFEKKYINIAVALDKDWLEVPLCTSATDIENYKTLVSDLYSVLKIIDTLKLEQNIGL